ncbi:ROK family protein [Phytoactinopolyspora limicola]|uniref:ROK family protein n=1 Tax=Phytoactinopolyspora limicola TaxID=2715536 RepID=UPI00140CC3EF|nr:ROK family protein [Phytoactinopolyspora limicola]
MSHGTSLLGVDLGGTSVRMTVELPDGTSTEISREPAPQNYPALLDVITGYAATAGPVTAAGLGLPGTVSGNSAGFVPALRWLEGQPVGVDLAARLGCPVTIGNDAAFALLAEARRGAARGARSAVLVAVGTGIGGALMVNGRIWRGARGSAGAWGWLSMPRTRPDPAHGGFEQAASGTALRHLAAPLAPEALADRARAGDPGAARRLDGYARRLGRGLAALASMLDPELVVIGGGVSGILDVVHPVLDDEYRRWGSPHGHEVPVVPAELGWMAGVAGAVEAARSGEEVWT